VPTSRPCAEGGGEVGGGSDGISPVMHHAGQGWCGGKGPMPLQQHELQQQHR